VKTQLRFLELKIKVLLKKVLMPDFTIVDMNKTIEIKNENIESKCGWTPFNGDKFKGTPTHTIIAGNIKMQDGKILGDPDGTPLKFS
jgi:dihydroorotase